MNHGVLGSITLAAALSSACQTNGLAPAASARPARPLDMRTTAPTPAPPNTPWDPGLPEYDAEAGVTWRGVSLVSECETKSAMPALFTSEAEFRRALCFPSTIDWQRFKIEVYTLRDASAGKRAEVRSVRLNSGRVVVLLEVVDVCPSYGYEYREWEYPAVIVPVNAPAVTFVPHATEGVGCKSE